MTGYYRVLSSSVFIGRSCICDFIFTAADYLSSRHLEIKKSSTFDEVIMHGKNGGYVASEFLHQGEKRKIEYGCIIKLPGISIVWLHDSIIIGSTNNEYKTLFENLELYSSENDLSNDLTEFLPLIKSDYKPFNNPKRNSFTIDRTPIELEPPPEKRIEESQGLLMAIGPAFTMAIPMVLGITVSFVAGKSNGSTSMAFMYTGLITAITSALLGGIWASLNLKNRKSQIVLSEKKRVEAYEKYVSESETKIKNKYFCNRNLMIAANPPVGEKILSHRPEDFIFNKQLTDTDAGEIRLGTGNVEFNVEIKVPKDKFSIVSDDLKLLPQMLKNKYEYYYDVPVCIDIINCNPVGIITDNRELQKQLIYLLIISIASGFNPGTYHIGIHFSEEMISHIEAKCLLLLPHMWKGSMFLYSSHENTFLKAINSSNDNERFLIFTDNYYKISSLINESESSKVTFIVVSDLYKNLPKSCRAVIQREPQFNGIIYLSKEKKQRQELFFDTVTENIFEKCVRKISELCGNCINGNNGIPEFTGFCELTGASDMKADNIFSNWNFNSTVDNISIPIGRAADDEIVLLDLHEKGMGPHGLIAGMTGSGKSEILQTIILGLAAKYHPREVAFLLIDYKGGGMAGLFSDLPHLMGSISNLSGNLVRRAMISIKSENERRQIEFNRACVNNIYEYTRLYNKGILKEPIPHIFIIIDEFAELKREQPDFMRELISVARVGRSLGIHLILATQKPSGTVDDNIQSNSRFRICLRLQDKMDSNEVIHHPDGAFIKNPGRAILQVGNDEVLKEFQGAYTMAPYSGNKSKEGGVVFLNKDGTGIINKNSRKKNQLSELKYTLNNIILAGEKTGFIYEKKLWQEPLPEKIVLDEKYEIKELALGIYDNPYKQCIGKLLVDIIRDGHILVLGFNASGKSTFLKTISYELIRKYDPCEYNLYYLDFGSTSLKPFENTNMCGGYFYDENILDAEKLFIFLEEIMAERKKIFRGGDNYKTSGRKRNLPAIVLFVDGIGTFREITSCEYDASILSILKEGENLGIYIIISAMNISSTEITGRMSEYIKNVFTFRLSDKYMYAQAFKASADRIDQPEDKKGRGLCKVEENIYEFQGYCLPDVCDQKDFLAEKIQHFNSLYGKNKKAALVPKIPEKPSVNDLKKIISANEIVSNKQDCLFIPVGYEKRSGKVYCLPLVKGRNVIVSGKSMSGKTEFIKTVFSMCEYMNINCSVSEDISFENLIIYKNNDDEVAWIIGVYNEDFSFSEREVFNKRIGGNPYVIHFGGNIDRVSVADFSYIPYTKQAESKPAGTATVRKLYQDEFYGDVVIAGCSLIKEKN